MFKSLTAAIVRAIINTKQTTRIKTRVVKVIRIYFFKSKIQMNLQISKM